MPPDKTSETGAEGTAEGAAESAGEETGVPREMPDGMPGESSSSGGPAVESSGGKAVVP